MQLYVHCAICALPLCHCAIVHVSFKWLAFSNWTSCNSYNIPTIDCCMCIAISFRAQYTEGSIDTLVTNVRLATSTAGGSEPAVFVEQCRCPRGYTGLSCEVRKYNSIYLRRICESYTSRALICIVSRFTFKLGVCSGLSKGTRTRRAVEGYMCTRSNAR